MKDDLWREKTQLLNLRLSKLSRKRFYFNWSLTLKTMSCSLFYYACILHSHKISISIAFYGLSSCETKYQYILYIIHTIATQILKYLKHARVPKNKREAGGQDCVVAEVGQDVPGRVEVVVGGSAD